MARVGSHGAAAEEVLVRVVPLVAAAAHVRDGSGVGIAAIAGDDAVGDWERWEDGLGRGGARLEGRGGGEEGREPLVGEERGRGRRRRGCRHHICWSCFGRRCCRRRARGGRRGESDNAILKLQVWRVIISMKQTDCETLSRSWTKRRVIFSKNAF